MTDAAPRGGCPIGKKRRQVMMSLDRFIAGLSDSVDRLFAYAGPNLDCSGRDSYPRPATKMNSGRSADAGRRSQSPKTCSTAKPVSISDRVSSGWVRNRSSPTDTRCSPDADKR